MIEINEKDLMPYKVGPLMYCPASNETIADKLIQNKIPYLTSICFCLEDSIMDDDLPHAEEVLFDTLDKLSKHKKSEKHLYFIRIRNPKHMVHIYEKYKNFMNIIDGFILPKFDTSNAEEYLENLAIFNEKDRNFLYAMPTLESDSVASIKNRTNNLFKLKEILDKYKEYIINIRVGGNDFSNLFGVRRGIDENIYMITPIRNIFADIINVFSRDYIVAGPVFEYFGDDENGQWAQGLAKELRLDLLNGFIGKTAVHPSQLKIIIDGLKVSKNDYDDALKILDWQPNELAVSKGNLSRMNEVKTHGRWALKTYILGTIYGIK